jgi:hypothetical protein
MSIRMMEAGIKAIQAGSKAEGARLLRIALKQGELTGALAATAYMWLAETTDDAVQKRNYYNDALNADPGNPDATNRLATALAAQLPGRPAPQISTRTQEAVAVQPTGQRGVDTSQIAAVIGGPNGPGTAFFVTRDGVLATTRFVVGGLERVTVELAGRRQVLGQVVRAWPDLDIALIHVDQTIPDVMPITPYPQVPDDAPLLAVAANGQQLRGKQRPSKRVLAPHWIMTDFTKLADAGGSPIFDQQGYLVGMLTKNSSRASAYLFGIHISAIRRCVDTMMQELSSGERRGYCPYCGALSRAVGGGYFYCEVCGSIAPQARQLQRYPQGDPFNEPSQFPCPNCGAQAGFYGGRCLRCGQGAAITS